MSLCIFVFMVLFRGGRLTVAHCQETYMTIWSIHNTSFNLYQMFLSVLVGAERLKVPECCWLVESCYSDSLLRILSCLLFHFECAKNNVHTLIIWKYCCTCFYSGFLPLRSLNQDINVSSLWRMTAAKWENLIIHRNELFKAGQIRSLQIWRRQKPLGKVFLVSNYLV